MKILNRKCVFYWVTSFLAICFVVLLGLPAFAADGSAGAKSSAEVKDPSGDGPADESMTEAFGQMTEKILEKRSSRPEVQVKQIARDLQKVEEEQKTLAAASAAVVKGSDNSPEPELLLKSKVELTERKRNLIERKAAFLKEEIRSQSTSHVKIQFFLTNVFADDASLFVITEQLKDLARRKAARISEKGTLNHEIHAVISRTQIEEKYLAAKKMLLAASRDDEKPRIQEAVSLAEDRLKVFQDTKTFLREQLDFADFRIGTIQEFDKLIRLRRRELLSDRIVSKAAIPYRRDEILILLLVSLCLLAGFLFRKRFDAAVRSLPSFLAQEGILACTRGLWFLGCLSLVGCVLLDLQKYRTASIVLGLAYLNISLGLVVFMAVKSLLEFLFMKLLQKSGESTHTEIRQTSSVYLLVRTVLMWFVFGAIFYQVLAFWALEREVLQWLIGIANQPLFQSEKIRISIWALLRSVLVFWLFFVGARFLNGILRARVYPNSSLDKNSQRAIKSVIQFSFLVIGAMAGIQLLGVDLGVFAVFTGTLGIGIGFGLQDIVKNVFSGFVIFFERPIRMGDVVEVGGVPRVVRSIRTRSTIVNTFDNISIVVPNSEFLTNRVVNWSHSDRTVRMASHVGVDYASDAEVVKETLLAIAKATKKIMSRPEPIVVFDEFADSALLFRLLYWVDVDDRMTVKSEVNFAIHTLFREKGISIPFPQRDLHLKSSDFDLRKKE